MITASRSSSTAASTAMAEMIPVTGTWPLRKPSSRERSSCGSISRAARTTGRPVTAAGCSMASNRSPGRLTTNSAMSALGRTSSTVTMESMPPPNGTSARRGVSGAGWAAEVCGTAEVCGAAGGGLGALDAQAGQVEAVPVGELAQAVQVELAQEGPLAAGQGQVAGVDDRRGRGLVVRDAGQQEHQPGGRGRGRAVPAATGPERDPLGEPPPVHAVVAGQFAGGRVDPVRVVAELLAPGRLRGGLHGDGLDAHRVSFWSVRLPARPVQAGDGREPAARLLRAMAEERVARGWCCWSPGRWGRR